MKKILFILPLLILIGCRSQRAVVKEPLPPVTLNNSDSVEIRTVIKTVYVPIQVEAEIPQQSEKNVTQNDSSHIETDVAFSDAWVIDGILHHTIENKPGTLKSTAYVPQTTEETEKENIKVREIPVPQPYAVEVERDFTWWESFRLSSFWYLAIISLVLLGWTFRRLIMGLFHK